MAVAWQRFNCKFKFANLTLLLSSLLSSSFSSSSPTSLPHVAVIFNFQFRVQAFYWRLTIQNGKNIRFEISPIYVVREHTRILPIKMHTLSTFRHTHKHNHAVNESSNKNAYQTAMLSCDVLWAKCFGNLFYLLVCV